MYPREFVEWLRLSCRNQIGQRNKIFDIYWVLIRDMSPLDEMSKVLYSLDEIYRYWQEHLETSEVSDMILGGKEMTFTKLKKKAEQIQKKRRGKRNIH